MSSFLKVHAVVESILCFLLGFEGMPSYIYIYCFSCKETYF